MLRIIKFIFFIIFLSTALYADPFQIDTTPSYDKVQTEDLLNSQNQNIDSLSLQNSLKNNPQFKKELIEMNPLDNQLWSAKGFNSQPINHLQFATVKYNRSLQTKPIMFAFEVNHNGQNKFAYFIRNYRKTLILKQLLDSLGYKTPDINLYNNVKIEFESNEELKLAKANILKNFSLNLGEKYIVNETETSLTLREGLLYDLNIADQFDLTQGQMATYISNNKRSLEVINLINYIADFNENLSSETWSGIFRYNNYVLVPNPEQNTSNLNIYDYYWLLQQIKTKIQSGKLDVSTIINSAYYPQQLKTLAIEILKSRINSLFEVVGQLGPFKNLNLTINEPPYIENGIINQDACLRDIRPQTISVICGMIDDYNFPNASQVGTILKNWGLSTIRQNVVSLINDKIPFKKDVSREIGKQLNVKVEKEWNDFYETGEYIPAETKIKPIIFPQIRFDNDSSLVLGGYGGLNGALQRVDISGYSIGLNLLSGVNKFRTPTDFYYHPRLMFSNEFTYLKNSVRVKPVTINFDQKIVEEKDDSTVIEFWLHNLFEKFDAALTSKEEVASKNAQLKSALDEFLNKFKVGESLILTESFINSSALTANYKEYQTQMTFGLSAAAKQQILSRIHIHRLNETQLQVYEDKALVLKNFKLSGGIQLFMPIVSGSYENLKSKDVNSNVYLINLKTTPLDQLAPALYDLFTHSNLEFIKKISDKFNIAHDVKQSSTDLDILVKQWSNYATEDTIKLTTPKGNSKILYYVSLIDRNSTNFFKLAFDFFNGLLDENNSKYSLNPNATLVGSDSPVASSLSQSITYEHTLTNNKTIFEKSVVITTSERQMKADKNDILNSIKSLNSKYNVLLFRPEQFNNIKHIVLYNLISKLRIYDKGIENLLRYSPEKMLEILKQNKTFVDCETHDKECNEQNPKSRYYYKYYLNKYLNELSHSQKQYDLNNIPKALIAYIAFLNTCLPTQSIIELAGGKENVRIESYINGFRYGDPTAISKPTLMGYIYGNSDYYYDEGPIDATIKNLDLISSSASFIPNEFLAQWLIKD